jgi:hypothetical protein
LLAGADPDAECRGSTPLHAAVTRSLPGVVALLLAAGADPARATALSPLLQAIATADVAIVTLLMVAGAHGSNDNGDTDALVLAQKQIHLAGFRALRWRAIEVCSALHQVALPAPLLTEILVHACAPFAANLPYHYLWDVVVGVRHFHERNKTNALVKQAR